MLEVLKIIVLLYIFLDNIKRLKRDFKKLFKLKEKFMEKTI
jgi:hypothetical protein